jgi:hypothetical protein
MSIDFSPVDIHYKWCHYKQVTREMVMTIDQATLEALFTAAFGVPINEQWQGQYDRLSEVEKHYNVVQMIDLVIRKNKSLKEEVAYLEDLLNVWKDAERETEARIREFERELDRYY